MPKGTISVKVRVSDDGTLALTKKSAAKLKTEMVGLGHNAQEVDRRLKGASKQSANATKNFSKMQQGLSGGLVPAYATLAAQVFALSAAFRFLQDAGDLRVLREGQVAFAASTGVAMRSLAEDIQSATDAQIKFAEASQAAAIGTAAGLTADQLVRLGGAAKDVSIVLGRDVTDSFNRLIRGVTKAEPELLDELGIVLRLNTATSEYKTALGITGRELTAFERSQAVANNVLTQAEEKYSEILKAVEVAPNSFNKFAKAFDDTLNRFKSFITVLEPVALFLAKNPFATLLATLPLLAPLFRPLIDSVTSFAESSKEAAANSVASLKTIRAELEKNVRSARILRGDTAALAEAQASAAADLARRTQGLEGPARSGLKSLQRGDALTLSPKTIATLKKQADQGIGAFATVSEKVRIKISSDLTAIQALSAQTTTSMRGQWTAFGLTARNVSTRFKIAWIEAFAAVKAASAAFVKVLSTLFTRVLPVLGTGLLVFELLPESFKEATKEWLGFSSKVNPALEEINEKAASLNDQFKDFVTVQKILSETTREGFNFTAETLDAAETLTRTFSSGLALNALQSYVEEQNRLTQTYRDQVDAAQNASSAFNIDFLLNNRADERIQELISLSARFRNASAENLEELQGIIQRQFSALETLGIASSEAAQEYSTFIQEIIQGQAAIDVQKFKELGESLENLIPDIRPQARNLAALGKFVGSLSKIDLGRGLFELKNLENTNEGLIETNNRLQEARQRLAELSQERQRMGELAIGREFTGAELSNIELQDANIELAARQINNFSSKLRELREAAVGPLLLALKEQSRAIEQLGLTGSEAASKYNSFIQQINRQDLSTLNIEEFLAAYEQLVQLGSLAAQLGRLETESTQQVGELLNSLVPTSEYSSAIQSLRTELEVLLRIDRDLTTAESTRKDIVKEQLSFIEDLAQQEANREKRAIKISTAQKQALAAVSDEEAAVVKFAFDRLSIQEKIRKEQEQQQATLDILAERSKTITGAAAELTKEQKQGLELSKDRVREAEAELVILTRQEEAARRLFELKQEEAVITTKTKLNELGRLRTLSGLTSRQRELQERFFAARDIQFDISRELLNQKKIYIAIDEQNGRAEKSQLEQIKQSKINILLLEEELRILKAQEDVAVQLLESFNQAFETGLTNTFADLIKNNEGSFKDAGLKLAEGILEAGADTLSGLLTDAVFGAFNFETAQERHARMLKEAHEKGVSTGSQELKSSYLEGTRQQIEMLDTAYEEYARKITEAHKIGLGEQQALEPVSEPASTVLEGASRSIPEITPTVEILEKESDVGFFKKLFGQFGQRRGPAESAGIDPSNNNGAREQLTLEGREGSGFLGGLEKIFNGFLSGFANFTSGNFLEGLKDIFLGFKNGFGEILNGIMSAFSGLGSGDGGGFASLFSGIAGLFGAQQGAIFQGGFQQFANGGMVTRPTLGLIGEGRMNEAVVPLPDGKAIPVNLNSAPAMSTTVNVNIEGGQVTRQDTNAQGEEARKLGKAISLAVQRELQNQARPGGLLSPLGAAR